MGLDAYVHCNCYQEGKTTPPPFPRDWLHMDEDGSLSLIPERETDQNWGKFHRWQKACCPHPNLKLVFERISNWTGVRLFQETLAQLGTEKFPTLNAELAKGSCSHTAASDSALALRELDHFQSLGEIGRKTVLVNSSTGEQIQEYVAAYEGIFIYSPSSGGYEAGINATDFFVLDRHTRIILFQSRRFRQIITPRSFLFWRKKPDVLWQDLETGNTFAPGESLTGNPIPWPDGSWEDSTGGLNFEIPTELHVEQRPRTPADFEYILTALRTVFAASTQSGNPVFWC